MGCVINLTYNFAFPWIQKEKNWVKGFAFVADTLLSGESLLDYFASAYTPLDFEDKLLHANGQFTIVLKLGESILFAVDRLRNFPLFYAISSSELHLSDSVQTIIKDTKFETIDSDEEKLFIQSGFTSGNKTLIQGIYQIQAGEYVVWTPGKTVERHFYHLKSGVDNMSFDYSQNKQRLKEVFFDVAKRMLTYLDGRPALVPLSGGFDSRLIVVMLKKLGYSNVICFSYGHQRNYESEISRSVAHRLGFKWCFVDHKDFANYLFDANHNGLNYFDFITNYSTQFFFQEYFAAKAFSKTAIVEESVLLPGHSGDFIAGSHLVPFQNQYSLNKTIAHLIYKYYSLAMNPSFNATVAKRIRECFSEYGTYSPREYFEISVLKERQAKLIVNSSKVWNYYGFRYYLPLWDNELVDFFDKLPFEDKFGKKLYNELVCELFQDAGVLMDADRVKHSSFDNCSQFLKTEIKKRFPFLLKHNNIWKNDILELRSIMEPMIEEVELLPLSKNITSVNGIIILWTLQRIRQSLNELR